MKKSRKGIFTIGAATGLAAVMVLGLGVFPACGLFSTDSKNESTETSDEPVTVRYVGLNNFDLLYDVRDEISFDNVTLTVTYSDNSTREISDIRISDAKDRKDDEEIPDGESEAVLYTDGLYSESVKDGDHDEGEFDISCYLSENAGTYSMGTAIIEDDIAMHLMVVMYEEPSFLTQYKNSVSERSGDNSNSDDDSFISKGGTIDYCVGDDNPFVFKPTLTVMHDRTFQSSTYDGFSVEIEVYLETDDGRVPLEEGNDFVYSEDIQTYADEDGGEDAPELSDAEEETYYFVYSKEDFSFDFTEKAVGESFRIEMSLLGYERDFTGALIQPVGMELTVCDGWNAYSALDLGRINFIGADTNTNPFTTLSSSFVFWAYDGDGKTDAYERVRYDTLWRSFLAEKEGCEPTDFDEVHGMFLHGNMTVTPGDVPERYFITENEARNSCTMKGKITGDHIDDVVGSLRNSAELYTHCMNTDFLFDGNLFKLDFSGFKYIVTDLGDGLEPGKAMMGKPGYPDSDFYIFKFVGLFENCNPLMDPELGDDAAEIDGYHWTGPIDPSERCVATFENTELVGNLSYGSTEYSNWAKSEGMASGSLNALYSIRGTLEVDNCIVREFKMAVEASYTRGELTYAEENHETYYCTDVMNTKFFDMYNSAEILYFSAKNKVTNCVYKRLGGPAVFLYTKTKEAAMKTCYEYESGCEMDGETIVENYLACDEAWFVNNGATVLATLLPFVDALFNPMGKTIYTGNSMSVGADGEQIATPGINLIYFVMNDDFDVYEMNADMWYNGSEFLMTEYDESLNDSLKDDYTEGGAFSSRAEYNSAISNYFLHSTNFSDGSTNDFTAAFSTNIGKVFAATGMDGFLDGTAYTMHSLFFETEREKQVLGPEDTEVYVYNTMSVACGIVVTLGDYLNFQKILP